MSETQTETTPEHPLDAAEIDEATVSQLIAKDPLELKDEEIETIIHFLRTARARWAAAQSKQRKDKPGGRISRQKGGVKGTAQKLKTDEKDDVLNSLFD